eukprot:11047924-Alexandrium_andersonii.AAC.1
MLRTSSRGGGGGLRVHDGQLPAGKGRRRRDGQGSDHPDGEGLGHGRGVRDPAPAQRPRRQVRSG